MSPSKGRQGIKLNNPRTKLIEVSRKIIAVIGALKEKIAKITFNKAKVVKLKVFSVVIATKNAFKGVSDSFSKLANPSNKIG